ncbi:hypothetical protein PMKS-002478 [Pichia membranifaciens]|uniref:Uncharacterized protein n=1 Tax=Pichia membranifaciens TaxID=4926 RepID=A0A1Q2YHH6_9ASCO|nr:hypothetical protein PMKS-002478 [Pichia membranifaciens]
MLAKSVNTASRGDPSDTFALVEFFPDLVKPYAKPVFDGIYQLSVLLGLVRPWNDEEVDIGNIRSTFRVSGTQGFNISKATSGDPVSSDIDERRRQVALKVLEQSVDPKE